MGSTYPSHLIPLRVVHIVTIKLSTQSNPNVRMFKYACDSNQITNIQLISQLSSQDNICFEYKIQELVYPHYLV